VAGKNLWLHRIRRGGTKEAVSGGQPGLPILFWFFSEFSATGVVSPRAGHEFIMQFFDEANANWQLCEPRHPVLHCRHLIANVKVDPEWSG